MEVTPKLFLTSMSGPSQVENMTEMIEPLLPYIDGVIWCLNDCPKEDAGARYLESVKGAGEIIYRGPMNGRHWFAMNETLFTKKTEEGDLLLWTDPLERPMAPFVSRIKSEIYPMMVEADVSVIYYYGKSYLFRYYETLQYSQTPHWVLAGYPGRAVEWSAIEPNEDLVRKNMRPLKRTDKYHFIYHYLFYFLYPAGSNSCALGLDQWPPGDRNQQFAEREARRLEFRRELKKRGIPLTVDAVKTLLAGPLDDTLKDYLLHEKVLSDSWHHIHGRSHLINDTHDPRQAVPIDPYL